MIGRTTGCDPCGSIGQELIDAVGHGDLLRSGWWRCCHEEIFVDADNLVKSFF